MKKTQKSNISDLTCYASEQNNPSNMKHVYRIIATLPVERFHEGVGFTDTPGLGSLATAEAAETMTFLPICYLGIVLIDAGSILTSEDIHTVFALRKTTLPVQILMSKAHLLSEQEQCVLSEYISKQI